MATFPSELVHRHHLVDGTEVTVRPIRPDDAAIEQAFVRGLSEDSRYFRFMGQLRELSPANLKFFTEIDYDRHMALIATIERGDEPVEIGVARYIAEPDSDACEFAIAIDDAYQGSGLAGILMARLMEAAKQRGFRTMEGHVLTNNHRMLRFSRQLGFRSAGRDPEGNAVKVVRKL